MSAIPNGLWGEDIHDVLKSYDATNLESKQKLTILGFDAEELRKATGGKQQQTTLRAFLSCMNKPQTPHNETLMTEKWLLDYTLEDALVDEVSVPYRVASKLVKLFADGKEVAYIARYRGDAHEGMSCDQIRHSFKVFSDVKDINKKVEKAIDNISTKTNSEEDRQFAMEKLKSAREPADITEVTQLYATSRKTKATIAREMGLEEVARDILEGKCVSLSQLVGSKPELKSLKLVEENTANAIADLLNRMPETVEAVKRIAHLKTNVMLSVCCELSNKARKWTADDKSSRLISNFNDYLNFKRMFAKSKIIRFLPWNEEKKTMF
ncbi:S1 RNA binding domain 1 [Parelaphostrongylus tenuis]|uniref:S1 RNA binding domain 1 n=1 Tax=Parelaphostrongylus tenuis TaxID=148309 RepID=A0AAD5R6H0_PARTN|nr:S1 RNA binding domain 1 [Parelaphostrongylus tenuis]